MRSAGAGKIAVPVKIEGRIAIPIITVQNAAMAKSGARGWIGENQVDNLFPTSGWFKPVSPSLWGRALAT